MSERDEFADPETAEEARARALRELVGEIEIHRLDEWSGLYLNGELQVHGDHYHADEWLYDRFGVKVVEDSRGWLLPDGSTPRQTLAEVYAARDERERAKAEAARLRAEADEIERKAGIQ